MASEFGPTENAGKILSVFAIIFITFIIFLSGITNVATSDAYSNNYEKKVIDAPLRGFIYSRDGKVLSRSFYEYELAVNGSHVEEALYEEFARVLAIYTGLDEKSLLKDLKKKKRAVLIDGLNEAAASDLVHLTRRLDGLGFFKTFHYNGREIRRGLEITRKGAPLREYPYADMLEPVLGYYNKAQQRGTIGLENAYEHILAKNKKGVLKADRDAVGHMILNKNSSVSKKVDGSDIMLTVNSLLQKDIEGVVDEFKASLDSEEVVAVIMDSQNGEIYAVASSNRYDAQNVASDKIDYMKMDAVQYLFEPGSVLKPFVVAKLLEEKAVGVYDLVRGYNGRYRLGKKVITDSHAKEWFSVEEVIYYSSNIAISQLAEKLSPYRFNEMLESFGLAEKSGVDLPYELVGRIPNISQLKDPLIRATVSYGYGINVNLMQLIKGFNVFNNDGKMITPKLARKVAINRERVIDVNKEEKTVISPVTAAKMLKILRKTVTKGTGVAARVDGVFTAGKTGTAHVAKEGGYADTYHSSFLGFANEEGGRRYTIGVLVIDPKIDYYASKTAAPIFKACVERLVERGWLSSDKETKSAL